MFRRFTVTLSRLMASKIKPDRIGYLVAWQRTRSQTKFSVMKIRLGATVKSSNPESRGQRHSTEKYVRCEKFSKMSGEYGEIT